MFKVGLKLFIITLVASVALATVNFITAPFIAKNENDAREAAMIEVLGTGSKDSSTASIRFSEEYVTNEKIGVTSYFIAVSETNDQIAGYVVFATRKGDQGDISICVGLSSAGIVSGVKLVSHNETPGLGANAAKSEFLSQYEGKAGLFSVVKSGRVGAMDIVAITSATHTTDAVTDAVNDVLLFYKNTLGSEATLP